MLTKEKRLRIGRMELAVAFDERRAHWIRRSVPYQYLVRPAFNWLHSRRNGNGHHRPTPPAMATMPVIDGPRTSEALAILERTSVVDWYHTLELPHQVVTPGFVDHRDQVHLYGLPEDMHGLRVLDVATYDGFWAFEMERRGADVIAIDIDSWADLDLPRLLRGDLEAKGDTRKSIGLGFKLAHEILNSQVPRRVLSVYDLSPEQAGTFDLVFVSDLLLHLRDPQRALESVCSVVRDGGVAIIAEVYNPALDKPKDIFLVEFASYASFVWWRPSVATLIQMMKMAGFKRVEEKGRFVLSAQSDDKIHKVILKGYVNDSDSEN